MQGISNQHTHLYPSHKNASVHLTTTTDVRRFGQITDAVRNGWSALRDFALSSPTSASTLLEWPCRKQRRSGLTASALVSDISAPADTIGVGRLWLLLRLVSVAQRNRPLTMLSFNVQSIDLHTECTVWRYWMRRQSHGCSTPAPNLVRPSRG